MGRMSASWPIGFLIASVVCAIIGGALYGYGTVTFNNGCLALAAQEDISYCVATGALAAEIIAGEAFLGLFGLFHLLFWILLIVYLVKRSNANRYDQSSTAYNVPSVPSGKGPVQQVNPV